MVLLLITNKMYFFFYYYSEEFNIIEESGNYEHWKYSVHYKEHLSNLPYIKHTAHGHYSVKPDDNGFLIGSQHRTCFLTDFDCGN